jgi:hypothetical protein
MKVCCGFLSPLKIHRLGRNLWVQCQAHYQAAPSQIQIYNYNIICNLPYRSFVQNFRQAENERFASNTVSWCLLHNIQTWLCGKWGDNWPEIKHWCVNASGGCGGHPPAIPAHQEVFCRSKILLVTAVAAHELIIWNVIIHWIIIIKSHSNMWYKTLCRTKCICNYRCEQVLRYQMKNL